MLNSFVNNINILSKSCDDVTVHLSLTMHCIWIMINIHHTGSVQRETAGYSEKERVGCYVSLSS